MPRDVINAILDRQVAQEDLVDGALAGAAPQRAAIKLALRSILRRGMTEEEGRVRFREALSQIVLADAAQHVPAALALVRRAVVAEAKAIKVLGSRNLTRVPALRKTDVMARRAEQKGLGAPGKGETDGAPPVP
jgi:hypothetical protein